MARGKKKKKKRKPLLAPQGEHTQCMVVLRKEQRDTHPMAPFAERLDRDVRGGSQQHAAAFRVHISDKLYQRAYCPSD